MTGYRRKLTAAAMVGFVSVGVFAQKGKGDKRPPKSETKVVVEQKREKPPPSNPSEKKGRKGERPEEE